MNLRFSLLFASICLAAGTHLCLAQTSDAGTTAQGSSEVRPAPEQGSAAAVGRSLPHRSLPDIPELMRQVEAHQRQAEAVEKSYIYHSVETQHEQESKGREKVTTTESDHFWINGAPVRRVVRKNGKDLSPEELEKEDKRIEKESRAARDRRAQTEAKGNESDPQGHEEITVSRLLELGAFTNPRRIFLKGRDTIQVDYTGDPHAKTRNRGEDVIRDLAGTVWIDEQDKVLVRAEGRFVRPFKVGAGLIFNIKQDTSFVFQQTKVNEEVWLPSKIEAQGSARALLFSAFSGRLEIVYSDYRKFRTTTTILPDFSPVQSAPPEDTPH